MESEQRPVKVAITGAAGQIGYQLCFRIASGQVFGEETPLHLLLIEIEPAMKALEGVLMELEDCAFPLLQRVDATADLSQGFDGIDWAILVGAAPRKAGMERKDLIGVNGKIFREQGKVLNDRAGANVRALVVGNPCNTNCFILMKNAPDIPKDRFFAMTRLDENRSKAQLAKKAGVAVKKIENMIVWGNHSSTMVPDFYHARIDGKDAPSVVDEEWLKTTFIETVQKRGAEIIKARGASSAASAANAAIDTIRDLLTPSATPHSVAIPSKGEYGITEDLVFSYPVQSLSPTEYRVIEGIEHNSFIQAMLKKTEEELLEEREAVKELF